MNGDRIVRGCSIAFHAIRAFAPIYSFSVCFVGFFFFNSSSLLLFGLQLKVEAFGFCLYLFKISCFTRCECVGSDKFYSIQKCNTEKCQFFFFVHMCEVARYEFSIFQYFFFQCHAFVHILYTFAPYNGYNHTFANVMSNCRYKHTHTKQQTFVVNSAVQTSNDKFFK